MHNDFYLHNSYTLTILTFVGGGGNANFCGRSEKPLECHFKFRGSTPRKLPAMWYIATMVLLFHRWTCWNSRKSFGSLEISLEAWRQVSTNICKSCGESRASSCIPALPLHQRNHGGAEEKREITSSRPSTVYAPKVEVKGGSHLRSALWEA